VETEKFKQQAEKNRNTSEKAACWIGAQGKNTASLGEGERPTQSL